MSNILKVTTPITGYENSVNKQNMSPSENMHIKNPIDPTKVVRPDDRANTNGEQGVRQGISYNSNFGNFVQSLQNVSNLREIMTRMVFGGMTTVAEAGISQGMAEEINSLFQMLQMSPDKLKEFLKSQMMASNKMQGPFFNIMRQILNNSNSVELKSGILNFLKKYNDMSSGEHLLENIKSELNEIGKYMFRNDRQLLQQLADRLLPHSMNSNEINTQLLKEEIIPFLGKYISDTRNMGKIRDLINLLAFNTSRYENGNLNSVSLAFEKLMNFPAFQSKFEGMSADEFAKMLSNLDFNKAAGQAEWSDTFLNILKEGVRGEAGIQNREAFLNIMKGMLINESVYMPVMHTMLPMVLNGTPVFSEIWVDPDEESGNENSSEKGIKLLIKFDMKDVGFFDIIAYYENGKMDMLLRHPDSLSEQTGKIREGIARILQRNNIEVDYLAVETGKESIPVSSAFPKIFERRNSVNVTI